jgi:ABC-2 type transport system ATP-binding protein
MKRRLEIARGLIHHPKILFLDEPTAGVDVSLRKDMWGLVKELKQSGTTIILTTHYIEEAEEMADRIGIIRNGELILVDQKDALMQKLGKKELTLHLAKRLESLPNQLHVPGLSLSNDGFDLTYTFDSNRNEMNIAELLNKLSEHQIHFKDLQTKQSSLEEIFVSLVNEGAHPHGT